VIVNGVLATLDSEDSFEVPAPEDLADGEHAHCCGENVLPGQSISNVARPLTWEWIEKLSNSEVR
jgi:hypothetical protein